MSAAPLQDEPPVIAHTLAGLRERGITSRAAARQVRAGRWQSPARGLYVRHSEELTPYELAVAALTYAGPTAVLTGRLPLQLAKARWVPAGTTAQLLVPPTTRVASSGRIEVTRWTHRASTTWVRGLPVAPWPRVVVDAGRACANLRDVRGVVLAAVADRRVTVEDLSATLALGQRNGSALVRRAVADAARGCASPPEAELVDALVGRGVPFLVNPQLWCDGVLLGSCDVLVVGRALGGEVESDERHGALEARTATYDRHERFADAGIALAHLSVARVRADAADSATWFLRRAALAGPLPPSITVVPRGPVLS